MSDIKVSQLPPANVLDGTEIVPIVQSGSTKRTTISALLILFKILKRVSFTIGDGSSATFTLTHNLNTRDVTVTVYRNGSPWDTVLVPVTRPDLNSITVSGFSATPGPNTYNVVVVG
jgi:hypothetical protein